MRLRRLINQLICSFYVAENFENFTHVFKWLIAGTAMLIVGPISESISFSLGDFSPIFCNDVDRFRV